MKSRSARSLVWCAAAAVPLALGPACSSSDGVAGGAEKPDGGGQPAGSGGASSKATGGTTASGGATSGGTTASGGATSGGTATTGPVDGTLPGAPSLPPLTNVVATMRDDSVAVAFDPVDGGVDYRIYPLPAASDVSVDSAGRVVIRNATYRCAGNRQGWDANNELNAGDPDLALAQAEYTFKITTSSEPTLGHVFAVPGEGRTPVYALAGYPAPPEYGWRESRHKIYTADASERDSLLAKNFRDDGIVFYVPKAGAGTVDVFRSGSHTDDQHRQFYFVEAGKAARAGDSDPPKVAFPVLAAPADGTVPLMAVTYGNQNQHTELAAGKERFQRAVHQGNSPLWHVEWSGLTEPTTLVVEALASGCPFQGLFSATHLAATPKGEFGAHQAFLTEEDLRALSPTGEVFVNGQHDVNENPKAIARSFIKVSPRARVAADWDYFQGFPVGQDQGALTKLATDPGKCWLCVRWKNDVFDIAGYNIDHPGGVATLTFGPALGQMWVGFDDWAQGVTGKMRFTALEKARVEAGKYLHATVAMDIVSTGRRYPQLIISDRDAPVQDAFSEPDQDSLIVQPIGGPSSRIEAQAIHGLVGTAGWDVNNQAPAHVFVDFDAYDNVESQRPPTLPAFELSGVDRLVRFDVYISPERMYLFLDGSPAGCTKYPSGFDLAGPVTVTLGAVIYHETVTDEMVWERKRPYEFWHRHEATETKRHYDDLAWKSGVGAPEWDEKRFPCAVY